MTDTPRKFPPGSPFEAYAHLIPTDPPLHVLPWPKERPQPSPGCLSDAGDSPLMRDVEGPPDFHRVGPVLETRWPDGTGVRISSARKAL